MSDATSPPDPAGSVDPASVDPKDVDAESVDPKDVDPKSGTDKEDKPVDNPSG